MNPKEALQLLKQLLCKNHLTTKEVYDYYKCKNIIEDALVSGQYILQEVGKGE